MFRDWTARKVSCFSFHKNKFRETCAIIFCTASPVFKFIKKRNKKIKNVVYVAAHATPFFVLLIQKHSIRPEISDFVDRFCE